VTTPVGWSRVRLASISLRVPDSLAPSGHAIDSNATFLEGPDLSVLVDEGPFGISLSSLERCPGYETSSAEIAELAATIVFCRDQDGDGYTLAAHLPSLNRLVVLIRAGPTVPRRIAEDILRSIELV
jgi:hypothetical protein